MFASWNICGGFVADSWNICGGLTHGNKYNMGLRKMQALT